MFLILSAQGPPLDVSRLCMLNSDVLKVLMYFLDVIVRHKKYI